ncbi:50S ribosomal protein L24 [Candidatus Bathyarchaeota archaeon A05DMB-2]|jgi:large subunit ribosomal protein L24|nr:50S ribosomal protein L24 [Candidatus Bathyarchaeota archaeon A05DMB-2]
MQATKPVKNPRKQRKMLYNAPAHLRHKFMGAPLSNELAASRGIKTLPVRKGDTIRIVRGDNAGFEGKVSRVDLKRYRIFVEGLTREKVDGTNIFVSVHPSKVMIKSLNLDDKWRKAIVERKQELTEQSKKEEAKKAAPKPAKKAAEAKKEELVEEPKIATVAEEKPPEEKPKAKPKAEPKKRVAKKKEEAPLTEKKLAARKKKETAPATEKPAEKETKPKAVKKTPAKRKSAAAPKKKEGGT